MSASDSSPMSMGEQLKAKREAMGLSLMDVAEVTKVSVKHLAALERDAYKELPSEIYAWLFLRTYAKHLGFALEDLKRRFDDKMHPAPAVPPQGAASPRVEPGGKAAAGPPSSAPALVRLTSVEPAFQAWSRRGAPIPRRGAGEVLGRFSGAFWVLASGGALLILIVLAWRPGKDTGFRSSGGTAPLTPLTLANGTGSEHPPAAATLAHPPVTPPPAHEGVLHVQAKAHTWIEIMVDGKERFALSMKPGEEYSWLARQQFRLWIGYPPGLEMKLNGTRLTLDSPKGEPLRDVEVFPDGRIEYHRTPFE